MTENPIYIVGGQNSPNYSHGVILLKDETGIKTVAEHTTPNEFQTLTGTSFFKGATRFGNLLYCCTEKEILLFSLPDFELIKYFTHPLFADVHDVLPLEGGGFLAAVATLDVVLEFDSEGEVVHVYNMLNEELVIDYDLDYRKERWNPTQLRAHVNHMVSVNGEVFVTRLMKKDAVSLTDISRRINIETERSHDGFLFDSNLYFTTVDGTIAVVDPVTLNVLARYTLGTSFPSWCRGLLVKEEFAWVGFTRRNESTMNMGPTRVAKYDLNWSLLEETELASYGLDTIYSIVDAS